MPGAPELCPCGLPDCAECVRRHHDRSGGVQLEPGWLQRQIAQVNKQVSELPAWMKREAGFEMEDERVTTEAARELLKRLSGLLSETTPEPWTYDTYNSLYWFSPEQPPPGEERASKQICSIPDHPTDDLYTPEQMVERGTWYRESEANAGFISGIRTAIKPLMLLAEEALESREKVGLIGIATAQNNAYHLALERITTLVARGGELERELEDSRDVVGMWRIEHKGLEMQITAAKERIGELEDALRPFASKAHFFNAVENAQLVDIGCRAGDLHRAALAIQDGGKQE